MIICIVGHNEPSKRTLAKALIAESFDPVATYTTGQPRTGETDGDAYNFVNTNDFLDLIHKHQLTWYGSFDNNLYGIPLLNSTQNSTIVIDSLGYQTLKKKYSKDVLGVYLSISPHVDMLSTQSNVFDVRLDATQPIDMLVSQIMCVIVSLKLDTAV